MPMLYTMPGTCSLSPNIAVAWLDAPVEVHAMAYGDHKKDDYLAINPKGKVPALRFDDGDVLTEASAILAWLGAAHGGEGYARDTKLGRKEAEALSYMTSEVHADYGGHFGPQNFAETDAAIEEVRRKTYEKLDGHYRRIDGILNDNGGEWYLGQRSFADTFLYVLTRWIEKTPLSFDDYPALKKHLGRMEADEGVQLALKRQNMEPIGA
ncbi:glutathione S-transferase family protein [Limimaricola litoreus]|uniref:Glutathione S-transferase N-terminal domain-containing protein n=1 Tax=Limimaricola litoreus TaxID=2955316 RepID=A0A9X2JP16_9RHOB|nr:glutathione S-transferase N-terminal domain-containing protein [Limimaricola litoreus]MCP1169527.1 glutathione S-transferase N-terminal domain-containing protein [Limimaricola litoreus]